jgi:hypothetical protein
MSLPMLADFSIRLGGGLATLLLLTSWRQVPAAFFRTHCQIVIGLLVLAALVLRSSPHDPLASALTITASVLAFLSSVAWGLGVPRAAIPLTGSIVAFACVLEGWGLPGRPGSMWALQLAGQLASAMLLGSVFTAMLLGHYYLTAPAMSIQPLRGHVATLAVSLAARAAVAAVGLVIALGQSRGAASGQGIPWMMLAARWGVGIAGPAVATYLAWKTVAIRSTQSATGILFVATIFVLFGELTAITLSQQMASLL